MDTATPTKRIFKALILNDYGALAYAEWVKTGKKPIETRMGRLFKHRGDIVICCGKTNSTSGNAGKALCIVTITDGMPMKKEHATAACIEWHPNRKSLLLDEWRHFSRDFDYSPQYRGGSYQGIFEIELPDDIEIIPRPDIKPYKPSTSEPQINREGTDSLKYDKTPYAKDIIDALDANGPAQMVTVKKGAAIGFTSAVIPGAVGYLDQPFPQRIAVLKDTAFEEGNG